MHGKATPDNAMVLSALLQERAPRYFEDLGGAVPTVRLDQAWLRPYSELYEFTVECDDSRRGLFVKVPLLDNSSPSGELDRPRLFPPVACGDMASLEHNAMREIACRFTQLDDNRFGSVRILELLHSPDAIVMEKVEGRPLRSILHEQHNNNLEAAFHNIGLWLRTFHNLPGLEHTQERSASREEFIAGTARLVAYAAAARAPRWLIELGDQLLDEAEHMPDRLPLGLAHGDFAPRNVVLSATNRITVLDTMARWRAPIYEDIALLLLSLRLTRGVRALWSPNSPVLARWSEAFLSGYFGDTDYGWPILRLFVLQTLLDRGCSYATVQGNSKFLQRVKRKAQFRILRQIARLTPEVLAI